MIAILLKCIKVSVSIDSRLIRKINMLQNSPLSALSLPRILRVGSQPFGGNAQSGLFTYMSKRDKEKWKIYIANYNLINKERIKKEKAIYYLNNKEKIKARHSKYYIENKDKITKIVSKYKSQNKKKISETKSKYYNRNKDEISKKNISYKARNKTKILKRNSEYLKKKRNTDPVFAMSSRIRSRILLSIRNKGFRKESNTAKMLGCSFIKFKRHIEKQFVDGMNWDNRSEWHLDHIIPLSCATTIEGLEKLSHYTNIRPLWAKDNMAKSDNLVLI